MKNFDKYQTMKERVKAFETFCKTQPPWCFGCPYSPQQIGDICFDNWLNAEADEPVKELDKLEKEDEEQDNV